MHSEQDTKLLAKRMTSLLCIEELIEYSEYTCYDCIDQPYDITTASSGKDAATYQSEVVEEIIRPTKAQRQTLDLSHGVRQAPLFSEQQCAANRTNPVIARICVQVGQGRKPA